MSWTYLDHTADVAVELSAPTREELFTEALRAFTDTLTPVAGVGTGVERSLEVEAEELEELVVVWLDELLYVYEVEELLFSGAEVRLEQDGVWRLAARVRGERYDPDRHPIKVLIKGVTFHHLEVREQAAGGWFARVIFDI